MLAVCLASSAVSPVWGQSGGELQIFGFFQNAFMHQTGYTTTPPFQPESARNSFSVQQHNLFFRKDLGPNWRAFVNYEFLNSFSSARRWGSANLEEVWVRYRANARFNLKFGLSIPVFNNLNEIKNRTPLLPYIVRPLVYETSFSEFIAVEEFLPARAFLQTYGFVPAGAAKLDYALFLGNGPNINSDPDRGQTGVDTTDSFLVGGRIGIRIGEWKAGLSATRDHLNAAPLEIIPGTIVDLQQLTRRRLGVDLSCANRDWSFEAEFIDVSYDDDMPGISQDKWFYYGTLGYRATERLLLYGSYWITNEHGFGQIEAQQVSSVKQRVEVPTIGVSYQLRESIMLKAQYAPVNIDLEVPSMGLAETFEFRHLSTAISVVF